MERRSWLERVADELVWQGLPARARTKLLEELRDHLEDLTEGGIDVANETEMSRRMGPPGNLAASAVGEHRMSAWVRRHPLLVFGLAPVPGVFLGIAGYLLAAGGVAAGLDTLGYDLDAIPRDQADPVAAGFIYSIGFVPFLALAAVFGWLAVRYRVGRSWLAAAVVQVALLAGMVTTGVTLSDLPGQSQMTLGVGLPPAGWRQAAQVALPLAVGWLWLCVMNRRAGAAVA